MNVSGYKDDLAGTSWLGEVVDVSDPETSGRVRVRVFGKFDEVPTSDIPWATPAGNSTGSSPTGGGFLSVPKVGSVVSVRFPNGDPYHPEYSFSAEVSDEVKEEVGGSYPDCHVLLYDPALRVRVFYTREKGIVIDHRGTVARVDADNGFSVVNPNGDSVVMTNVGDVTVESSRTVTVRTKDALVEAESAIVRADRKIHLSCSKTASILLGESVTDSILLGDKFLRFFNSHVHVGNLGYTTSTPSIPGTPDLLSKITKTQ